MTSIDSSRVLKAESVRELGSKVAFNYEDVKSRCDNHVEQARSRATELLEQARADAEAAGRQVLAEARNSGRQQGLADAEAEIERRAQERAETIIAEKLNTALPAIRTLSDSLLRERDRWLKEWESTAIRLSVAIAEKLVRRELQTRPMIVEDVLREVLELAAGTARLRVLLHPDDLALLGDQTAEIAQRLAKCSEVICVGDEAVSRGGCLLETEQGAVDGRLETQLERIASELLDSDG